MKNRKETNFCLGLAVVYIFSYLSSHFTLMFSDILSVGSWDAVLVNLLVYVAGCSWCIEFVRYLLSCYAAHHGQL